MSTMGETGYLIKIAPVLDEGAAGELEAELKRRLASIPPLAVNVAGSSEVNALSAAVAKVAAEVGNLNRAVSETGSVTASRLTQATAGADALGSAYQRLAQTATIANDAMVGSKVSSGQQTVTAEIQRQNALYREQAAEARIIRDMIKESGGISNFRNQMGMSKSQMDETLTFLDKYGANVKAMPSYWQRTFGAFASHIGQWTLMTGAIEGAALAAHTFEEAIKKASEFQVQGTLFSSYQTAARNEGMHTDFATQNDLLRDSIQLASKYGDEVNDVAQDLSLWYKRTGDLGAAYAMTNEALKFQLATGTQVEDLYRTLTALSSQLNGVDLGGSFSGDKFNLGHTHEILEMITAAAVTAGAGLHQLSKNGSELGASLNNSAIIMGESVEKDGAALRSLGYNFNDILALNASLIQAFGNTGNAASDAAEKIGRLSGGLAGLGKPGTADKLAKAGIDLSGLTTQKDVLEQLSGTWDKLTKAQQDNLAVTLASPRQYEALEAIMGALSEKKRISAAMSHNLGSEDQLAAQMADTFQTKTKRLNAEWEGFLIIIGDGVIPMLSTLIDKLGSDVIPHMATFIDRLQTMAALARDIINGVNSFNPVTQTQNLVRHTMENDKAGVFPLWSPFQAFGQTTADTYGGLSKNAWDAAQNAARMKRLTTGGFQDPSGRTYQFALPAGGHYDKSRGEYDFNGGWVDPSTGTYHMAASAFKPQFVAKHFFMGAGGTELTAAQYAVAAANGEFANPSNVFDSQQGFVDTVNGRSTLAAHVNAPLGKDAQAILDRMHQQYVQATQGNLSGGSNGGGAGSKYPTAAADAIDRQSSALAQLDKNQRAVIATDDIAIKTLKIKGASLDDLSTAYHKSINDNQALENQLKQHAQSATTESESYAAMADKAKGGAKDRLENKSQQFANLAQNLKNAAMVLDSKIQELTAQQEADISARMGRLAVQRFQANPLISAIKEPTGSNPAITATLEALDAQIQKLGNGPGAAAFVRQLETMRTHLQSVDQAANGLKESLDTGLSDGLQQLLTPGDSAVGTFYTDQLKLQKEYLKDVQTARAAGNVELENEANQWYAVEEAINRSKLAESEYQRRKSELEKSPAFSAFDAGLNTIGNSITSSIVASSNAGLNNQINGLQSQISFLNNEKNLLLGSQYAGQRATIEEELQALTVRENDLKKQEANPPLLKKVFEDVQKSFLDSFVKKLEDDLKGGAIEKILGADPKDVVAKDADTANKLRQTIAGDMADNVKAFAASVSGDNDSFKNGVASFGTYVSNLINAFSSSGNAPGSFSTSGGSTSAASSDYADIGAAIASHAGGSGGGSASLGGGGSGIMPAVASAAAALAAMRGGGPASGMSADAPNGDPSSPFGGGPIPVPNIKGSSANTHGDLGGKGGSAKYGAVAGDLYGAYAGYQQGGVGGALETGLSVFALTGNPYIAAAAAAFSLFSHHDDPAKMPDKYATSDWGQGLADFQGSGYDVAVMNANGQQFTENSPLRSQLQNQSESTYITKFIANNATAAKNILSARQLSLFTGLTPGSGNITGGKDGNLTLSNGQSVFWSDLISEAQGAVGAIEQFNQTSNSVNTPIISVNAYGGSGVAPAFSPWTTPGVNDGDVSGIVQGTYLPSLYSPPSSGSPSGSAGDGGTGGGSYGGGGAQTMTFTSNVYLDSQQIGASVNAYRAQRENAGWDANY